MKNDRDKCQIELMKYTKELNEIQNNHKIGAAIETGSILNNLQSLNSNLKKDKHFLE